MSDPQTPSKSWTLWPKSKPDNQPVAPVQSQGENPKEQVKAQQVKLEVPKEQVKAQQVEVVEEIEELHLEQPDRVIKRTEKLQSSKKKNANLPKKSKIEKETSSAEFSRMITTLASKHPSPMADSEFFKLATVIQPLWQISDRYKLSLPLINFVLFGPQVGAFFSAFNQIILNFSFSLQENQPWLKGFWDFQSPRSLQKSVQGGLW